MAETLRFAVPNGSLWGRLQMHLNHAGYPLRDPDRTGFCGEFNGIEFHQVDRRMLPLFLRQGSFHAGLTGQDLWINSGVGSLRSITSLCFSRTTDQPSRWVAAHRKGFDPAQAETVTIACELEGLASLLLQKIPLGRPHTLLRIDGSEELLVREGVADMVIVVTETGSSIKANSLEILPGCEQLLFSTPEIRAQESLSTTQEEHLQQLSLVLQAFVGSGVFVMVVFDIPTAIDLSTLALPCSVSPTVSPLADPAWKACQICVSRQQLGATLLRLKRVGAQGIVIHDVNGYIA
jgi:ATP phosphoribosyltransferase